MANKGCIPWNKGLTADIDNRIFHGIGSRKNQLQNTHGPQTVEMKKIKDSGIYELMWI